MAKKRRGGRDPAQRRLPERILAETHPSLSKELIESGLDRADNIGPGSNKKKDWRCQVCGHLIKGVRIASRTRSIDEGRPHRGCPFCGLRPSRRTRRKGGPLSQWLLDECLEDKNLTPKSLLRSDSQELRVWQCRDCTFKWTAKVCERCRIEKEAQHCPVCTAIGGEQINLKKKKNTRYLTMFLRTPKNTGYIRLVKRLPLKHMVHWKCRKGHFFRASIKTVKKCLGCVSCYKERRKGRNLAHWEFRELQAEFRAVIGRPGFGPQDVPAGSSSMVVLWQCQKSAFHRWRSTPARRTSDGRNCPYCAGKRVALEESLARTYSQIALDWDFDKNKGMTPDQVLPTDRKKRDWICEQGHMFEASCRERVEQNKGCVVCLVLPRNLAETHPELAHQWLAEKNIEARLTPHNVTAGSKKAVWWECDNGHEWQAAIFRRANEGHGCPFCAGKRVADDNSLASRYPQLMPHWDAGVNGNLNPESVSAGLKREYNWRCACGNVYQRLVRSMLLYGPGCSACKKRK